jgi:hypothetical protein
VPIDEHIASNMVGVVQLLATARKNINSMPTVVDLHGACLMELSQPEVD